jgi:hypothetical protein
MRFASTDFNIPELQLIRRSGSDGASSTSAIAQSAGWKKEHIATNNNQLTVIANK